ncbi:hypothetical protein CAter282_2681 [Collimonas arenae]|uniref:Uncharacterized protein n=1 Tax=Collimonas arenae TaxID=279058 RepID=A0A127QK18_9BURK|nr:hypothetical protein CAter10_2954 [Collimonas arenae]AMP10411.1 hypothetical protein CAter282_2681 [Collimonas arenae]
MRPGMAAGGMFMDDRRANDLNRFLGARRGNQLTCQWRKDDKQHGNQAKPCDCVFVNSELHIRWEKCLYGFYADSGKRRLPIAQGSSVANSGLGHRRQCIKANRMATEIICCNRYLQESSLPCRNLMMLISNNLSEIEKSFSFLKISL